MAVDRKQQMKEITERLEQGVKDIFTSEMYTTYLRTMAKFHKYSFNNTLLIAMQRPDATLVAGFNAWKNKFKLHVGNVQILLTALFGVILLRRNSVRGRGEQIDLMQSLPLANIHQRFLQVLQIVFGSLS